MNKNYLFLCAWISGSESAHSNCAGQNGDTKINEQKDLLKEFIDGNEDVFAVEVRGATNKDVAYAYGCAEAFHENYTAHDSMTIVYELTASLSEKIGDIEISNGVDVKL